MARLESLPARGNIAIFNRSYYEEVLVVRVHPQFLDAQRLPKRTLGKGLWQQRFKEINNFEGFLVDNGFEVIKIFLNVSKEEQCKRQLARIDTPEKNWKFNAGDIEERKYWDDYLAAYEDVLSRTSTGTAPWYVVPADAKWFARIVVAAIIANKLVQMDPQFPSVSEEGRQAMLACREGLAAECGGETVKEPEVEAKPAEVKKKQRRRARRSKRLTLPADAVADARLSEDVMRARRIGLDLAAQVAHIHSQQVRFGFIGASPYLAQKLAVREHFAGVLR